MRTIDDHIEDAERWAEELSAGCDPVQMTGWRPTCAVLAEQVALLQFKADENYEWEMRIKAEAEKCGWNLLDGPLFDYIVKAFNKIIDRNPPRWIPCSERMPEEETWVLVFASDSQEIHIMKRKSNYWVQEGGEKLHHPEVVTHWIYNLPPPEATNE